MERIGMAGVWRETRKEKVYVDEGRTEEGTK